jgi:16S rRNA G966 N2-methylase RsmD
MNTLKKIFPEPPDNNYNGLSYDEEGLWSITHPKEADLISEKIITIMGRKNLNILDMTAGCGGNMISFCKYFNSITGIEINKERFNILKTNLSKYNFNNYNLICDDSVNYIDNIKYFNVVIIDPPWGGPEYKKLNNIELTLSNINLYDIVKSIPRNILIILKIPFNYNYSKYKEIIIENININNMILLYMMN